MQKLQVFHANWFAINKNPKYCNYWPVFNGVSVELGLCIKNYILGSPSTPPLPLWLLLHPQFPLPSSVFYSIHSGSRFFLFFGKSPSHPLPSMSGLLAADPVPPSLFSLSASHAGGGYANSTLSFPNWLIEARTLWRPCLCSALSLFPLTTCILVLSASRGSISWKKPFIDLVRQ